MVNRISRIEQEIQDQNDRFNLIIQEIDGRTEEIKKAVSQEATDGGLGLEGDRISKI